MLFIELFIRFFLTGLFSIGGGLAIVPFVYDIGRTTGWFSEQKIADMLAISNSLPATIGGNLASYSGYEAGGFLGLVIAALALVIPGMVTIIIISHALKAFQDSKLVNMAFYGLRAASIGLIIAAAITMAGTALFNYNAFSDGTGIEGFFHLKSVLLAAVVFAGMKLEKLKKLHPIYFIGFSAVVGIIFQFAA